MRYFKFTVNVNDIIDFNSKVSLLISGNSHLYMRDNLTVILLEKKSGNQYEYILETDSANFISTISNHITMEEVSLEHLKLDGYSKYLGGGKTHLDL